VKGQPLRIYDQGRRVEFDARCIEFGLARNGKCKPKGPDSDRDLDADELAPSHSTWHPPQFYD
jgi:hypothetical protein